MRGTYDLYSQKQIDIYMTIKKRGRMYIWGQTLDSANKQALRPQGQNFYCCHMQKTDIYNNLVSKFVTWLTTLV